MNKPATNARWSGLSSEQVQTLENWLFDEKLTFQAAHERATRELGFSGSVSSIQRFYQRRARERMASGFKETCFNAESITSAPGETAQLRSAAMKMVGRLFLTRVMEDPKAVKDWESLARLLLQSEDNELRRQLKSEENQIKRDYLRFSQERFQFNVFEEAYRILPELTEYAESQKDPETDFFDQCKRRNHIKRKIFGDQPAWWHPENLEEAEAQARAAAKGGPPLAPHVREFLEEHYARIAAEQEEEQLSDDSYSI